MNYAVGKYCRIALALLLCGCASTPYIAARHISDPAVENDGYDVGCLGFRYESRATLRAEGCKNVRGGTLVGVSVEVDLMGDR